MADNMPNVPQDGTTVVREYGALRQGLERIRLVLNHAEIAEFEAAFRREKATLGDLWQLVKSWGFAHVDAMNLACDAMDVMNHGPGTLSSPSQSSPSQSSLSQSETSMTHDQAVQQLTAVFQRHRTFLDVAKEPARDVGKCVSQFGGMTAMLAVHAQIRQSLGSVAGRSLDRAWNGIDDWQG